MQQSRNNTGVRREDERRTYLAATLALRGNFSNETMLKFTSLIIIQIDYYSRITYISLTFFERPALQAASCTVLES